MPGFEGLTAEDCAIYAADKWASNVHNLKRMRVKDKMVALCDAAQKDLAEELDGLVRAVSDEIPNITNHKKVDAQWVYWFRDEKERKALKTSLEKTLLDERKLFDIAAQDKHLALAVVLRETELWVGLRAAPRASIDRRNLSAMLGKAWERQQLLELLKDLPEGAVTGLEGALVPVGEVTLDGLAELAGKIGDDDPAWLLGESIDAEDVVGLGDELAELVHRWLGALTRHYRFIAWSRNNDHIAMGKQIQEEKAQEKRKSLKFNNGDKVRIVSGVFSGKTGVVQGIDNKAQVKVQVGKLAVVIAGTDLTPAG